MSVAQQVSSFDKQLTFLELYQDFYNQRICSQVSEGTLGMYEYTIRRFCKWADEQGFSLSTVECRHVRAYVVLLSSSGYQ
jgi:site-specific recombinase XerD